MITNIEVKVLIIQEELTVQHILDVIQFYIYKRTGLVVEIKDPFTTLQQQHPFLPPNSVAMTTFKLMTYRNLMFLFEKATLWLEENMED